MCCCGKLGTKPPWILAMPFSLEVSLNTNQLEMPHFWASGAHWDGLHSTEWGTDWVLSLHRIPLVGALLAGLPLSTDWATGESAVWGPRLSPFPAFFGKGRLQEKLHPYFPHYYALGSILHFNTNLPEHFFLLTVREKAEQWTKCLSEPCSQPHPTSSGSLVRDWGPSFLTPRELA